MDDFVLNTRQIAQYPQASKVAPTDSFLFQKGGLGGPFQWINPIDLFASALMQEGTLGLAPNATISWGGGATIAFAGGNFAFSLALNAPAVTTGSVTATSVTVGGQNVATVNYVDGLINQVGANVVFSVNGRRGDVLLQTSDILQAGAAPIINAHFGGHITAPTPWNAEACDDTVATTAFVQAAICHNLQSGHVVLSYNGRGGNVIPIADDVTKALTVPGQWGLANTPPSGDVSKRIANTAFVDDALAVIGDELRHDFALIADALDQKYAPLDSPQFVGIPTGPTAAAGMNTGQLATTAFVQAAVTASTTGVSSFNTRTGAVTLTLADVTAVGGAPLASPPFTGIPTVPLRALHDNTTAIASTAFVAAEIAALTAGVTSFNTRTGAVVLTAADVTAVGGALLASPAFSGTPTAPTPTAASNDTSLATTAFVTSKIAALPAPVTSFNGRTGAITFQSSDVSAVGGALLASPQFTGNVTAPTATAGTSNTQVATTAFVAAAVSAATAGVSSFNTRTGAVVLTAGDVTAVGGALLAGPTFTGVPAAPTASLGTNTTQIATTAYVQAAIAAAPGGVSSFNGRTGSITFLASDLSAVGGAPLASPAFSGNPTAPTPSPGDADTSIATTAYVMTALAAGGGVTSFNGRAGVVTLNTADVTGAGGAPIASPVFTGTPQAPTASPGTANTQIASTAFVANVVGTTPAIGGRVLISTQDITTPVAFVAFTNLLGTYDEFELVILYLRPAADDNVMLRVSTNNGTTWDTSTIYAHSFGMATRVVTNSGWVGAGSTYLSYAIIGPQVFSGASGFMNLHMRFFAPGRISMRRSFQYQGTLMHPISGFDETQFVGGCTWGSSPVAYNALRIGMLQGGNLVAGQFRLYGIRIT